MLGVRVLGCWGFGVEARGFRVERLRNAWQSMAFLVRIEKGAYLNSHFGSCELVWVCRSLDRGFFYGRVEV